jgi:phosphoserine phosphatase
MTKILLIRHGHVEGIKPERFRGREPLELTAQGRAEAAAVAKRIGSHWQPGAIYTSPMGRCVKTAEAVAKVCAVAIQTCDDLNDLDYGAWQFKTFRQASAENPLLFAAWFATPHLSASQAENRCKTLLPGPPTLCGSCWRAISRIRACSWATIA